MSWLGNLFSGGEDPSKKANKYLEQIPGQTAPYYDPYIQAGQQALPGLQDQYSQLMQDPGALMNSLGSSYQQSPGFEAAMRNAMMASNHAAAAGGMAGSPAHQYDAMSNASDLASRDYGSWLDKVLGMYGTGLQGQQGMYNSGQQASNSMADMIAQTLASQGGYAYAGQAGQNQNQYNMLGNLAKGAGTLGAFMMNPALGGVAAAANYGGAANALR